TRRHPPSRTWPRMCHARRRMAESRYVDVFIDPNPNTPDGCGQRFRAEDVARPVATVRWDDDVCDVVGWSSVGGGSPCAAWAIVVEDSSAGTAVLVYGGDWGLRLQ